MANVKVKEEYVGQKKLVTWEIDTYPVAIKTGYKDLSILGAVGTDINKQVTVIKNKQVDGTTTEIGSIYVSATGSQTVYLSYLGA